MDFIIAITSQTPSLLQVAEHKRCWCSKAYVILLPREEPVMIAMGINSNGVKTSAINRTGEFKMLSYILEKNRLCVKKPNNQRK